MDYLTLFKDTFHDFGRRFLVFGLILYSATVMVELVRQILLENLHALAYREFGSGFFMGEILKEFATRPMLLLLPLTSMFFALWGFASLYFSFRGENIKNSITHGLKTLPSYAGFVITATLLTTLGFGILTIPGFELLMRLSIIATPLAGSATLFAALAFVILGIPGIYLLVSFSNGPFILLLEKNNIGKSLLESHRRISAHWFLAASFLGLSLLVAGLAYYFFSWLIFTLKLAFIPDLSFRGESMLRVFFYSIPWVICASFFDLAVYKLYVKFSNQNPEPQNNPITAPNKENKDQIAFSSSTLKMVSIITLIAFISVFAMTPIPVYAGGNSGIFGILIGLAAAATCVFAGCAGLIGWSVAAPVLFSTGVAVGTFSSVAIAATAVIATVGAVITVGSTALGIANTINAGNACAGSYDAFFGTCTKGTQNIYTKKDAKFANIGFGNIATPEEFSANPTIKNSVTINWKADAPLGVREYIKVQDTKTGAIVYGSSVRACTDPTQFSQGSSPSPTASDIILLPYGHSFKTSIDYEMCIQIKSKSKGFEALCILGTGPKSFDNVGIFNGPGTAVGCGCDPALVKFGVTPCGTLVDTDFTTPKLPISVDLKANGSDKPIIDKNKSVTLAWTSEYATSCTASGSWTGEKPVNGSEIVIPTVGKEIFTLTCNNASDSAAVSDSVGFGISSDSDKSIKIFNNPSINFGDSSEPLGPLKIVDFNISNPLKPGDTINVAWSVSGATKCEVDNAIGKIPCSGSVDVTFVKTTTFTLTATDANGNKISATKTVSVKKIPSTKEIKPE
ncbi:MAG: hypothetical protein Q7R94_01550 [bacterium]|nr:hypothetical protein [bacterium]